MEAEFVAASHTMAEMLGIIELLQDIGMAMQKQSIMRVDNQAAIAQIEGEDTSGRVKHSDVRYKFVKNLASKKVIKIQYCESKIMRADILTKVIELTAREGVLKLVPVPKVAENTERP
uniref:Pol polyprotein putative n=1 Tax=Albugo laibachii Nc14 TaxID=890382 RepID=F0X2C8_9STRA|nr:pol polyprotein putative [Albugo laibachii Nc14]|eukprot:CCA28014.1 pol polyprotein putative [Albugo laibachii Nc14]